MNVIDAIKERRSVRKFENKKVDRKTIEEIIEISRFAPSWGNYQVARYTIIDDENTIKKLATDGVKGFTYNIATLENAKGVCVISFTKGKSGKLDKTFNEAFNEKNNGEDGYNTDRQSEWEVFDAGIATQTFCLAAHAKGVGTCIMGIIAEKSIAKIIDLPQDETIAALIVYGYEDGAHAAATPRKEISEIVRFI
ncbi:nitroreductase [Candidatus Epulonipiscium fishelsonii]|uniref:Nitroreductase n=1 Tax=Candidatus Epulonipiscium fishelsonii TaxID=77094 RepID=A0ACC8XIC5_9FIRM|nr:nitroreductase [Epulopiscium sp. SCG-D08WGA-EpuloA1]